MKRIHAAKRIASLRQYSIAFLGNSFALTEAQAKQILATAGEDRVKAAELARLLRTYRADGRQAVRLER